jgi:hypothetical protein
MQVLHVRVLMGMLPGERWVGLGRKPHFGFGKSCHSNHWEVLWLITLTSTAHGTPPTRSDARTAVHLEVSILLVRLLSSGRDDS